MITVIRDRLVKNKAYKYIIWVLAIALAIMWTVPGMLKNSSAGEWIAQVNGADIGYSDFIRKAHDKEYQLHMMRQQYGQYADMFLQAMGIMDPRMWALEDLIRDQLLNEVAGTLGIHVSPDYVTQKLSDAQFVYQALSDLIPPYAFDPRTGSINPAQLKSYLRQLGLSLGDFEDKIEQTLVRFIVAELASLGSYVPEFELVEEFKAHELGKSFSVLVYPLDTFMQKARQEKVEEGQVKAFYDKQAALGKYWVPEQRSAIFWKFDPSTYGITVTDEAVKEYYDEHKMSHYVATPASIEVRAIIFKVTDEKQEQEVYAKAKKILQEVIQHPETFADKARLLSEDKESAAKGGLLPSFAKGSQESAIDRAAFLLKKDGDIVPDVVRTKKGFEIVQRVRKIAPVFKTFSDVSKDIRNKLMNKEFGEQFARDMSAVAQDGNEQALREFAASHGGTEKKNERMANDGSKAAQAIFELKDHGVGFYVEDNAGYGVTLTGVSKRHLPSLDKLDDVVKGDMYQERAADMIKNLIKQAQDLANKDHMALKDIADQHGVTIKKVDMIKKANRKR